MTINRITTLLVTALMLTCFTSAQAHTRSITMLPGHTTILAVSNVKRVAIGDGEIVDAQVLADEDEIILISKKLGVTDLRVWREGQSKSTAYTITVREKPIQVEFKEVNSLLQNMPTISQRRVGDMLVLEGRAANNADLAAVQRLAQIYPGLVANVLPPHFERKKMIAIEVKVLEVTKRGLKRVGFNWVDFINGPTYGLLSDYNTNGAFRGTPLPGSNTTSTSGLLLDYGRSNNFFGVSSLATSVLNLLVQNGDARILAEPTLSCVSGGHAEFVVGGEVPIPVTNPDGGISVTFKQFGIILNVDPTVDDADFIRSKIEVEVSSIDPSVSVQGIPGFLTRKTNTELNTKSGEVMVISGLLSNETSKTVDKVPLLGDIPILGEFFKSRELKSDEKELIILVKPVLTAPQAPHNLAEQKRFEEASEKGAESVRFNILD